MTTNDPLPPAGSNDPTGNPGPPKPQPQPAAVQRVPVEGYAVPRGDDGPPQDE